MFLLAAVGCAPDGGVRLPETEEVYSGAHVRLHTTTERSVCGGTGPAMEAMLSFLGRETELGELDQPIDVYLLSEDQVSDACDLDFEGVFACSFVEEPNPLVVSSYLPTEHELVHSYLSLKQRTPGRRHAFLEEGFASVYGRDGDLSQPTTQLADGLSFARSLPIAHYPRAAHFMNFVVDEFGPAVASQLVLNSAGVRDGDELDSTFLDTLGTSTAELVDLYDGESAACASAGWQRGYDCEASPEAWHFSGTLRLDIGHECSDLASLGSSDGPTFERFSLDFPEPATVSIQLDTAVAEQYPKVRLTKCGACDDEFVLEHDLSEGPLFNLQLDPGTYVLRALYSSGEPEPAVLKLRRE